MLLCTYKANSFSPGGSLSKASLCCQKRNKAWSTPAGQHIVLSVAKSALANPHSAVLHRLGVPQQCRNAILPVVFALSRTAGYINCRLNPMLERASK